MPALDAKNAAAETADPAKTAEFAERVLGYFAGAAIAAMINLGDRLGLYKALRGQGPRSSTELAEETGLNERWIREWLHGQASSGLLRYDGAGRYELTPEQSAVLADDNSTDCLVGGFALLFPLVQSWDRLHTAFETGRGVPYNELGRDHAVGEARFSGPWMRANLVPTILPALEGVVLKLEKGAKAVDVGCGAGGAVIEMARAFPRSEFHGYDSSELAISLAGENLRRSGLKNVTFHHSSAAGLDSDGRFDFVLTWDCLHDMTNPLESMRAIRRAIRPDGAWLIVDINGAATPEGNYGHPLGGLLYAFSVLDCLSCGTWQEGGAGLGTLGFPEPVARQMVAEAGFSRFKAHDFGNPLNSFYEVRL